jgi:hypothetical protein
MTTRQNKGCFCKVCKDAGKSESDYTSHFVKDKPGPDGIVICPTLLSQRCRYCNGAGHTPSHCPSLARDKKRQAKDEHERDRAQRRRDYDASTNTRSLTKEELSHVKFGGFSALRIHKKKEDDEFPALVSKTKPAATFGTKTFASVAIAGELDASKKEIERLKTELASSKARQRLSLPTPTHVIVPYRCKDAWEDEEDEEWMRRVET